MQGSLLAVVIAVTGLVTTALWFGVSQRRKAESEIGIQSLANLKWRECVGVVLEALHRDGYSEVVDSTAKAGGDTEVLLSYRDEKVLLGYKHGTAYQLSEANVREFVNALHMRGARRGILLTLGSTTGLASRVASTHDVQLIDGPALWAKVRHFVQPQMLERVKKQASSKTRHGLWAGTIGSLLFGGIVYLVDDYVRPQAPEAPVEVAMVPDTAGNPAAPATVGPPRSDAAMLAQINATARAMAEVAKLSSTELAQRRVDVAKKVALIPQVDNAIWSAQRTLLVSLNKTDGKDKALIEEVCRIITQHEEMRFTRIQLEAPAETGTRVRWRLCE
jgi:hypothetical protein